MHFVVLYCTLGSPVFDGVPIPQTAEADVRTANAELKLYADQNGESRKKCEQLDGVFS
jgi:hypothetical protein